MTKDYDVTLIRKAYSAATVQIAAESLEEAEQIAYERAGDFVYSEYASEYELA